MKLGRGRRDERARSIALVTFGFGSAENVLLRSLRSSAARSRATRRGAGCHRALYIVSVSPHAVHCYALTPETALFH